MRILILGAGGHGAVVADCVRAEGRHQPVGFLDDDPSIRGSEIDGVQVTGPLSAMATLKPASEELVLGIGNNQRRLTVMRQARTWGFSLPAVIHPRAWASSSARCGAGTVLVAGAVVNARAVLGSGCIINTGASVDHDCVLGDGVHFAPGARAAGAVTVGAGTFVGMGAMIIEGIAIGENCLIGAGAVVIADLPAGSRVVGVPAHPLPVATRSHR